MAFTFNFKIEFSWLFNVLKLYFVIILSDFRVFRFPQAQYSQVDFFNKIGIIFNASSLFYVLSSATFISSMWLEWDVIKIQISLWRSSYTHTTSNTPLRNWISVLSCRVISSNTSTNEVAKPLCSCFFYFILFLTARCF